RVTMLPCWRATAGAARPAVAVRADHRLHPHHRAREGELVGQHPGDGDVLETRSRGPRRVHAGVERVEEVAAGAGAGSFGEVAGADAVGDEDDAGQVGALVTGAHLLERL